MELDYSKVIMVGLGWATRNEDGSLKLFNTAKEAAGGESAVSDDADSDPDPDPNEPVEIDQAAIVAAIAAIGSHDKKPNVKDVEQELKKTFGEDADITADERDEAYDAYLETLGGNS